MLFRIRRRAALGALSLSIVAITHRADAEPRVHLGAGVAHAVGKPQSDQFGLGGAGVLAVELPVTRALGVQAELSSFALEEGDAPVAGIRPKSTGFTFGGMVGARLRPFTSRPGGLWIDANVGGLSAGSSVVPGFDAHVGWDFRVGRGRFDVGPMLGFTHLFDTNDGPNGGDANVPWAGVQFSLGATDDDRDRDGVPNREDACPDSAGSRTDDPKTNGCPRGDRDGDSVFDDEDACPDTAGIRTGDAKTNGCPRHDQDNDGVFDDEDACPDTAGIRTKDPKTNGCPRGDRDKDAIYDEEDACPDAAGPRTDDPKTNGCPSHDRDKDGVLNDDDACPDIPGIKTSDPKTNGCPASEGNVRVEGTEIVLGEIILFDTDSLRVRHVSWALVKRVADLLNSNPDILEVNIEGHADQTGRDDYNVALSQARAESVKKLLVHFKVDPARITTHAYGNTKPRVQGSSKEALHQNRRVEFTVTRTNASNLGGKP